MLRVLHPILGNVFAVGHLLLLTKREMLERQFSVIHGVTTFVTFMVNRTLCFLFHIYQTPD